MQKYKKAKQTMKVGVILPFSGPIGLWGNSCEACATLAAAELNSYRGILGSEVELEFIDSNKKPQVIAANVAAKVNEGQLSALIGTHTSDVRKEVTRTINGKIPYIYTPMYEGGDKCKGVFLTGLTPDQSVLPTLDWLCNNVPSKRWFFIGSDYIWPTKTHSSAINFLHQRGRVVVANEFVSLAVRDFSTIIQRIENEKPDVVVVNLLGDSSIAFNRQFSKYGLDKSILRYCGAIEENMLFAIGHQNCHNIISSMGYYDGLNTNEANAFKRLYYNSFGDNAPALNQMSISSYEGIMLLADLAQRSNSLITEDFEKVAMNSVDFQSPRGELMLQNKNVQADVFIVQANNNRFTPLHCISYR